MFFLKHYVQNVVVKLVLETFLKDQTKAYLWINSLKFLSVCNHCSSQGIHKYIETKVLTTCFYFISSF